MNWTGFETSNRCCQGLSFQPLEKILDFIVKNSFNAIRIPICAEVIACLDDKTKLPCGINPTLNPNLKVTYNILDYTHYKTYLQ